MKKWIVMLFAIVGAFAYGGHQDKAEQPARHPGSNISAITHTMMAVLAWPVDVQTEMPSAMAKIYLTLARVQGGHCCTWCEAAWRC